MIIEVCIVVITIILGVIGLELVLWLRSVRKLVNEAEQTAKTLNAHLPEVAEDIHAVSSLVRQTTEQVGGTVNEVAVGLENLRKNPLQMVSNILAALHQLGELWHEIRSRHQEENCREESSGEKADCGENCCEEAGCGEK